jgi:hypothetical protein
MKRGVSACLSSTVCLAHFFVRLCVTLLIAAKTELGMDLTGEEVTKYMEVLRRGCGFLVNHAYPANLAFSPSPLKETGGVVSVMQLKALRDIQVRLGLLLCSLHLFD